MVALSADTHSMHLLSWVLSLRVGWRQVEQISPSLGGNGVGEHVLSAAVRAAEQHGRPVPVDAL